MQCGHCVAVCPVKAVEIIEYDINDIADITPQKFTAEELLSFIKTGAPYASIKTVLLTENCLHKL
jgi:ferredoxin